MSEPLVEALERVRELLLDPDSLVRAVGAGRRKGAEPRWRRVELRYVDIKAGRHLQVTAYDATQAHTSNHRAGDDAAAAIGGLLDEPFGNWHVDTVDATHQLRVTKKLEAVVHTANRATTAAVDHEHDREKERLLPASDPLFAALDLTDAQGRIKPSRQAKYRQVEEFLRILDASVTDAMQRGRLRRPTEAEPLRIVDLGCGNAYLTFAAQRYLAGVRGLPVAVTGVDVKAQSREHNTQVAARLGLAADFVVGSIADAVLPETPEVVLALHACDTATDEALARAVEWEAALVLAAPCCHHDVAAQLRGTAAPEPYGELLRHGILRERFADTLTDALRASLMRERGYRVDVMQFVESTHTPRNTLLRAVRSAGGARRGQDPTESTGSTGHVELAEAWGVRPRLAELLTRIPGV